MTKYNNLIQENAFENIVWDWVNNNCERESWYKITVLSILKKKTVKKDQNAGNRLSKPTPDWCHMTGRFP